MYQWFKWITGFTDLSHPFRFLSFPKFSSSSPSRYNLEDGPSTKPCIWSSLSKYLWSHFLRWSERYLQTLPFSSLQRFKLIFPSHVDDFKTSDWRDVTDLSVFSEFFRVDATDQSIDFFASTVDKIFQKNFNFSWHHTSSCFINIHDYANYTTPTHTYSKLGYIITEHLEIACVHRSINKSINSRLLENWFCLAFFASTIDKKVPKKFQFSWRHTSLIFIIPH